MTSYVPRHPFLVPVTLDDSLEMLRHGLRHATLPADEWESLEEAWETVCGELGYEVVESPGHLPPIRTREPDPDDHAE